MVSSQGTFLIPLFKTDCSSWKRARTRAHVTRGRRGTLLKKCENNLQNAIVVSQVCFLLVLIFSVILCQGGIITFITFACSCNYLTKSDHYLLDCDNISYMPAITSVKFRWSVLNRNSNLSRNDPQLLRFSKLEPESLLQPEFDLSGNVATKGAGDVWGPND